MKTVRMREAYVLMHAMDTKSAQTKTVGARRAEVRTFDRMQSVCTKEAIEKGPLAERARNQKVHTGSIIGPRERKLSRSACIGPNV